MKSEQNISVTGLGMITPAGLNVLENWDNIIYGRSQACVDSSLDGCPVNISCRVKGLEQLDIGLDKPWFWDNYSKFAYIAAKEAIYDAGLNIDNLGEPSRVAVIIGSGAGGTQTLESQYQILLESGGEDISPLTLPMGLLNMAAGQVAIELNAQGPCFSPCSACASGATAIGLAKYLIENDMADIVVAGGAEAAITPFYVSAFARMRTLSFQEDPKLASRPFDSERDGFVIGEGAGILILESETHAKQRGAKIKGYLSGYGFSADAYHVTTPHPAGEGAINAITSALNNANCTPEEIDYVNAHGTSTRGNDQRESAVIQKVFGCEIPVSSTKGVTGHLLGAGGAIEAIYSLKSLQTGIIPPTAGLRYIDDDIKIDVIYGEYINKECKAVLSNSFGFGGQNVSLVFSKYID